MNHKGIQKGARVDNVMYELAGSPAEIKARLAGVPVYTVVNSKKEFILVSGDDDTERQLSLLFLNREDAEGFQKTVWWYACSEMNGWMISYCMNDVFACL